MTTQDLKAKPIENGCIFVTDREFRDYVKLSGEGLLSILPVQEVEQRMKDMLSGKRAVTFHKWQVRVRER